MSHDLPVSAALEKFLMQGWAADESPEPAVAGIASYAAARRSVLAARFPGERLVIPAGVLKVRSNSTFYRFRPHTAHTYLCGLQEPDAVLVIEPDGSARLLRCPPKRRSDSIDFFTDRKYGEAWTGWRPSLRDTSVLLGVDCADRDELESLTGPARVRRGVDPEVDALIPPREAEDAELAEFLDEMRLIKDEWELGQLQLAVDHTVQGFADVTRALPEAIRHHRGERWVEGIFGLRARAEGHGVGYHTIAASGAHGTVLHWNHNSGSIRPGDMLLLDAGVEVDTLYTADVTRTLPVSGAFTPVQRELYQLVLAAQNAGIAAVRPGAAWGDFHLACTRVLAEGLADMGILPICADEAMDPESGLYRRYTLCSSGHMLGMDVHDCSASPAGTYRKGTIKPGMVLTVEPGLYFQPDDLTVPAELRGIGVRVEDDLAVTPDGNRVLSAALPKHPDEVESWMAALPG